MRKLGASSWEARCLTTVEETPDPCKEKNEPTPFAKKMGDKVVKSTAREPRRPERHIFQHASERMGVRTIPRNFSTWPAGTWGTDNVRIQGVNGTLTGNGDNDWEVSVSPEAAISSVFPVQAAQELPQAPVSVPLPGENTT